jgi:hypothetical protein
MKLKRQRRFCVGVCILGEIIVFLSDEDGISVRPKCHPSLFEIIMRVSRLLIATVLALALAIVYISNVFG